MTHLVEKDDATANNRTFHFRLFTSDGTSPDTTASGDSIIVARGSTTTFVPDVQIAAVHAAQGMYSAILSASNVSNLGPHSIYHTQGSFPQEVVRFDVVNFNPYSNFSNIAAKTYSGVTVGSAATILAGNYSGVTISGVTTTNNLDKTGYGVTTIAAGTYSGVTVGSAATILAGTYSGATLGINNIAAGNYSGVTLSGITATNVLDKLDYNVATIDAGIYSGVTLGVNNIAPGTYSGVTVGINNIAAGTYSGVTVGINNIAAATYSGVTVGSAATILAGGIVATSFGASAIDAAALATDAGQEIADRVLVRSIAGGADSGRSVGQALYVLRNRVDASSSIGTVYQVNDTTSAWTFSTTTADFPISSVDPA